MREVMSEVFEFILSLVILIGGGFMLYTGKAPELSSGIIGIVITYWFQRRSNESAVNNLLKQSPVQSVLLPVDNANVITPSQIIQDCNTVQKQS